MAGPRHTIYAVVAERTDGIIDGCFGGEKLVPRAVVVADSEEEAISYVPEMPENWIWAIGRLGKADKGTEKGVYAREHMRAAFLDGAN
jgi:hypothetical protein